MSRRGLRQGGFSLVEVALVMIIFVLLASAVLAANELLMSARARGLAADIESYRTAYLGFVDRYRALPGDFALATERVRGASVNGDGNGRIEDRRGGGGANEPVAAWEHLAHAGFLQGGFRYRPEGESVDSAPIGAFGAFPHFEYGNRYAGNAVARHNISTGNLVPPGVLGEVDRKLDDGSATTGSMRYSSVDTVGLAPSAVNCFDTLGTVSGAWRPTSASSETNCGATWLLP